MNRIEAINRTKALIAEAQEWHGAIDAKDAINQGMRDWIANIILAELRLAMKGLILFRKAVNGNPEEASEADCKKLAARLHRRAIELSTKKPGPTPSDETICIFYFFPRIIGTLMRIAQIFDPSVKMINADGDAEAEDADADAGEMGEPEAP